MNLTELAREIILSGGRKQSWLAKRMNDINPALRMTPPKMSALLSGKRQFTGEELVAFCIATDTDFDEIMERYPA